MTDPNDQLENELTNMRPRAPGGELIARIESALSANTHPWPDRLLLCAISAGSLAACVIVAILTMSNPPSLAQIHPSPTIAQVPTIGSYTLALARDNNDWINPTK